MTESASITASESSACCATGPCQTGSVIMQMRNLSVSAGKRVLLQGASLDIAEKKVFGIIGPSGGGKSTLLRALNRLTDLTGVQVSGDVLLHGRSIYAPGTDVNALRARVGMLFQQPVVFPATIAENVVFGARRLRSLSRAELAELTEASLREASLWDEVKDRLKSPALKLSVGQQQRLCLARTLATKPEVILMDEPTSALDPKSTEAIENLVARLKSTHTIVLVTHNVRQARELADTLACICVRDGVGQVIACGAPGDVLCSNCAPEIDAYLAKG